MSVWNSESLFPLWPVVLVVAVLVAAIGNVGQRMQNVDDSQQMAMDEIHSHTAPLEISGDGPVPTVDIEVEKDAKSGWNVQIVTVNFRFAPEHASGNHVAGEGHAHIYVDGVKIGRVYGNWYHLEGLAPGQHTVRVTLNANDHRDYAVNGEVVAGSVVINN